MSLQVLQALTKRGTKINLLLLLSKYRDHVDVCYMHIFFTLTASHFQSFIKVQGSC